MLFNESRLAKSRFPQWAGAQRPNRHWIFVGIMLVVGTVWFIHDNWIFDCKLFEGMGLWQTQPKQSARAGVLAFAGISVSWPPEGNTPTFAAE